MEFREFNNSGGHYNGGHHDRGVMMGGHYGPDGR